MKTKMQKMGAIIRIMALTLIWQLSVPVSGVLAGQPTADVKAIIDEVMGILHNPAYQAPGQKAARLRLIEQSALRRLDYPEMAKRSLEETWDRLTPAQRNEFVRLFSELLKASYADKLDDFAKSRVTYEGESQKGDAAEVRVLVWRTNDKIPVKFQLRNSPQGWMVYDLVIEDVSLVDNFRTEFGRIIKASSYAGLIKCFQLKLQANIPDLQACPVPPESSPPGRSKAGN